MLGACALAFLVLFSYEIARPAAESLFLERHGKEELPRVWLFVALGATAAVALYGRFAARVRLLRLFAACSALSAASLVPLQLAWAAEMPGAAYLLYVWKDVYIVVLVEIFWSFANTVYPLKAARWIYGLFCAAGSVGSAVGARTVQALAAGPGTEGALWLVVPTLLVVAAATLVMDRVLGPTAAPAAPEKARPSLRDGLRLLTGSRYLTLMLGLILVVQLVVTLVDYQFNGVVEQAFPDKDQRTAAMGLVYEWIAYGSLALQLATGLVIRLAGVERTLIGIPLIIAGSVVALAVAPVFAVAAAAKVAGKAFDYSLFRATKELLYLPLPYAEKTRGKAVVDMLTYRVAKGGVALLLNGLVALGIGWAAGWLAVGCVLVWLALSFVLAARYQRTVASPPGSEGTAGVN